MNFVLELLVCTFAALIGAVFVGAIYYLVIQFSRIITSHTDPRAHLAVALPAIVDEGLLLYLVVGGLGLIGIGTGTELLNEDPETLHYIGWLVTVGFISFMVARMLCSGHVFRLFAYIGVSVRLAIMGVVSFHFASPSFEPLAIPAALLFTLFLFLSHYIRYYLEHFGLDPHFGRNRSCPTHQEALASVANIGNQLSVFGLGLLGVGIWASLAEKSQGLHEVLAIYTGCTFWLFYGAKILGKGVLFEVLVFLGAISEISMFMTSGLYVLYPVPGYKLTVLSLSTVLASLGLEWCRIRRLLEKLFPGESEPG